MYIMPKYYFIILFLCLIITSCDDNKVEEDIPLQPIVFTVIGDVPYGESQITGLKEKIDLHNNTSNSEFVVHVGDIKSGQTPCNENTYEEVASMLSEFATPTFVILGDNEYNDCDDPLEARAFWDTYFLGFNSKWSFGSSVNTQSKREENWAFIREKVLFIGLNIVGSTVHDKQEWDNRLDDNVAWLTEQYETHGTDAEVIILFGHANMVDFGDLKFEVMTTAMAQVAQDYQKPILYIHGDGHKWIDDNPWDNSNLRRIQIDGGVKFVQVTIDPNTSLIEINQDAF